MCSARQHWSAHKRDWQILHIRVLGNDYVTLSLLSRDSILTCSASNGLLTFKIIHATQKPFMVPTFLIFLSNSDFMYSLVLFYMHFDPETSQN